MASAPPSHPQELFLWEPEASPARDAVCRTPSNSETITPSATASSILIFSVSTARALVVASAVTCDYTNVSRAPQSRRERGLTRSEMTCAFPKSQAWT